MADVEGSASMSSVFGHAVERLRSSLAARGFEQVEHWPAVAFDDETFEFRSSDLRLKLIRERGVDGVLVSSAWGPGHWFDDQLMQRYLVRTGHEATARTRSAPIGELVAPIFRHYDTLADALSPARREETERVLRQLGEERAAEMFGTVRPT